MLLFHWLAVWSGGWVGWLVNALQGYGRCEGFDVESFILGSAPKGTRAAAFI